MLSRKPQAREWHAAFSIGPSHGEVVYGLVTFQTMQIETYKLERASRTLPSIRVCGQQVHAEERCNTLP